MKSLLALLLITAASLQAATIGLSLDTVTRISTPTNVNLRGNSLTVTGAVTSVSVAASGGVSAASYTSTGTGGFVIDGSSAGIRLDGGSVGNTNVGPLRISGDVRFDSTISDSAGSKGTSGYVITSVGSGSPAVWGPRYRYPVTFDANINSSITASTYYIGPNSGANAAQDRYSVTIPFTGRIVGYTYFIRTGTTTTAPNADSTIDVWLNNVQVPGGQALYTWAASTSYRAYQATTSTVVTSGDKVELRLVYAGAPVAATLGVVAAQIWVEVP